MMKPTDTLLAPLRACSSICGSAVENLDSEHVGTISDLVLDTTSGHALFAVVEVGAYLGLPSLEIGVPWTAFINRGVDRASVPYLVDVSRAELEDAARVGRDAQ